jgi:hypothetical protein
MNPAMFWKKVRKSDGCWEWTGAVNEWGYGRIGSRDRLGAKRTAHRLSWLLAFGPIPDGALVLHACDNPPCVRPDHLFLGTHEDNMQDRHNKGRYARGEQVSGHRLTEAQARYCLNAIRSGRTILGLSRELGISRSTIYHVGAGQTWAWLNEAPLLPSAERI